MDTTHLPNDTLLNSTNFFPWKARIDNALCALGLPTIDAEKPQATSTQEWKALSELAARTIHNFVPANVLKQAAVGNYYDHAKLVKDLQGLTQRFRFMDLPPELRNRIYAYTIPMNTWVIVGPVRRASTGLPSITSVSRQVREESLPLAYHRGIFMLDFRPSITIPPRRKFSPGTTIDIRECAQKWAKSLSGPHKKFLRCVRIKFLIRCETEAFQGSYRSIQFELSASRGLAGTSFWSLSNRLDNASSELVAAYAKKMEEERQLLHLQGEALIMALTRDDEIWKYGTLKCK